MRKIASAITALAALCGSVFCFTACGDTEAHVHDFSGSWVNTEAGGHYHICADADCTEKDGIIAHTMEDVGQLTAPDTENGGLMQTRCSVCGYEDTRVLPPLEVTHSKGEHLAYDNDGATHWYVCGEHADCGQRFEEAAHLFEERPEQAVPASCAEDGYTVWECVCGATEHRIIDKETVPHSYGGYVNDTHNEHYRECNVCLDKVTEPHSWDEGVTVTPPTFWEDGEKTLACNDCGHEKTESISPLTQISHAEEFSVEDNGNCWSYGKFDITGWDGDNFQYTAIPATQTSGDAYVGEGVEIKAAWLSGSGAFVAYTVKEDITISVSVTAKQVDGGKRMDIRTVQGNVAKFHGEYNADSILQFTEVYSLTAGETLYMVFSPQAGEGFEQTEFSINISKTAR